MNRGSPARRGGTAVLVVIAVVIPAIGLNRALDRLDRLSERAAVDEISPLTTAPTPVDIDEATSVTVTPVFGQRVDVVAPSWQGLVTEIDARPGQSLESGAPVVKVDGVVRRAYATAQPLYRPLTVGDEGGDVADLHGILAAAGFLPVAQSGERRFSASTMRATREFAASIGIRSASISAFDPAWVLWQPQDPFVVENIAVAVGAPAPAAGEPILIGNSRVEGIRIEGEQGLPLDRSGSRILTIAGLEVPVEDGLPTADGLAQLTERRVFATETSSDGAEAPSPLIAQLRLSSPVTALAVPASAVQASLAGDGLCVWIGDEGPNRFEPRPVAVYPGGASTVYVTGRLTQRSSVLTNPADYLDSAQCP